MKQIWGWISYKRKDGTVDGLKHYIVKVKAEHDDYNFTMIELSIYTNRIKKALDIILGQERTREEILSFNNKTIRL